MSEAERDRCRHRWVLQQYLIHFMRCDILTASNNDVFDPAGQVKVEVLIKESIVPGVKPSIRDAASVGFRIVLISTENASALNDNFTLLVRAEVVALGIHNAYPDARAYADGTGLPRARRQGIGGHLMCSLSHSVGFRERNSEHGFNLMKELLR